MNDHVDNTVSTALTSDPLLNKRGTIYLRKRRGTKMHFLCSGPTLFDAPSFCLKRSENDVFFWVSCDGELIGLLVK